LGAQVIHARWTCAPPVVAVALLFAGLPVSSTEFRQGSPARRSQRRNQEQHNVQAMVLKNRCAFDRQPAQAGGAAA
jgi:hypothetical protein